MCLKSDESGFVEYSFLVALLIAVPLLAIKFAGEEVSHPFCTATDALTQTGINYGFWDGKPGDEVDESMEFIFLDGRCIQREKSQLSVLCTPGSLGC